MRDYLLDFLPDVQLAPSTTALVVIDMQYASGSRQHGLGALLKSAGREDDGKYRFDRIEQVVTPNIQRLLERFRAGGLQVVYLTVGSTMPVFSDMPQHMRGFARAVNNTAGNLEHEILDDLRPRPGELVLNKTTAGAFNSTGIDTILRSLGIKQLVLTGISTNSCVETTARDAADRGYGTLLVEDACGAASQALHDATLVSFRRLFGRVASTDEVLAELASAAEPLAASVAAR